MSSACSDECSVLSHTVSIYLSLLIKSEMHRRVEGKEEHRRRNKGVE